MHPSVSKFAATLVGALIVLLLSALHGCGRGNGGCDGPALNVAQLQGLRKNIQAGAGGARGVLILPNPVDATNSTQVLANDSRLANFSAAAGLFDLASPQRLENDFLKIRIKSIQDAASTLAVPNSQGVYSFPVLDPHYSETMAYFSVQTMIRYVEALGFPVVKTRPLYVMVRAESEDKTEINAFYDHNYLNPQSPRMLRVFGETQFPLGADRDIYWHEFGHFFNESSSHEVGMDYAADAGAKYTEGASMHECLADILAMSVSNRPYIGRWIARNFKDIPSGQPLRSAVDTSGTQKLNFKNIINADGKGAKPERYEVAEWCSRVLWDIRTKFTSEDPDGGPFKFERMVWSAVGLLKRDTSLQQFHEALVKADDSLHCGGHGDDIKGAFASRGFDAEPAQMSSALTADARAIGVAEVNGEAQFVTPAAGSTVVFDLKISNRTGSLARNVRVKLESLDRALIPVVYQQSFGDLAAGASIGIGQGGGLDYTRSVKFEVDSNAGTGKKLRYRVHILVENGPETVLNRELPL